MIRVAGTVVLITGAAVPAMRHRPPWQVCPDRQLVPQEPQCEVSVRIFLHVPLQEVWPEGQETCVPAAVVVVVLFFGTNDELNCPFMQVSPYGAEKPHPPQLSGSVLILTHAPLHRVIPSEHWPLTGLTVGPGDALVLFCVPAGMGEPERIKKPATPIMSRILIIPSTSTDRGITTLGQGSDCKGFAGRVI
jgi:hypothetical protein